MPTNIKYCAIPDNGNSFFFDHVHIKCEEQITLHQHEELEISFVLYGRGTRIIGNNIENFNAGEVVLIPSNIPHCWSFDPRYSDAEGKIENITIIFHKDLLYKVIKNFPEFTTVIQNITNLQNAVKLQDNILFKAQKILKDMSNQNNMERLSSLLQLFSTFSKFKENAIVGRPFKANKSSLKMQEIYRYVLHNYQRKLSLEEVASITGMSKSSFCVFFKKNRGISFITFLNHFRILSSYSMLEETEMSISEICYAVGYSDVPHFNRTFKKVTRVSPTVYRKNHN